MKIKTLALSIAVLATLLTGCGNKSESADVKTPENTTTTEAKNDVVSGASQVNDEETFKQKISKDNTNFMIIVNKDLTFTEDLVVESGVKKDKEGKEAPNRAIAPAAEDASLNISERYTLTVPNLIFAGENGKFENGILKGNIYVQAEGFILQDATVDGNIYFATEELKDAFKVDETSKITGTVEVKEYTK
ncbi:hypothetical protein [uncultured Clostridium sp.]|uniref:hypothetical protein n=1 Tax=uncultured Clostridium sp. TaxID=59620 RepID=UPI00258C2E28|nr:hypothetical protein [uncultured Clostridium sp.]